MAAVVAAATRRALERQLQINGPMQEAQEEQRNRTLRLQQASVEAARERMRRLDEARESRRQRLAATIRALQIGQILALASRESGDNGLFAAGDAGIGRFIVPGWVEILWPNRSRTRTAWPNVSWYAGRPITAAEVVEGAWAERLIALTLELAPSEVSTCDEASCVSEISEITAFLGEDLRSDEQATEASDVNSMFDHSLGMGSPVDSLLDSQLTS